MKIFKFFGIICILLLIVFVFKLGKGAYDFITGSSSNKSIELIEKSSGVIPKLSLTISDVSYPEGYYDRYRSFDYSTHLPSKFPAYAKDIVGVEPEFHPEDLLYFYDGNDLYAYGSKEDNSKFCGDSICHSSWFYWINKNKQAVLIAGQVAMGGLTDVDKDKVGGIVYSKTDTMRSSMYFQDKRGNLFVSLQGQVYLFKSGKIIGKLDKSKTKLFSSVMFSDGSNTYIGDPVYANNGGYLTEKEKRIYRIGI